MASSSSSTPTLLSVSASSSASSSQTAFSMVLPSSDPTTVSPPPPRKSSAFWLSYAAICLCTFVSALDITAIPTALPSMVQELAGSAASTWIGSGYTLASAALIPFTGNLANIFGRRPILLGSIILFAIGSVLAGSAQSMEWLVAARAIQGMGGGGMSGLSSIIVADLVPLSERGAYQGFKTMMFACAAGIGPILGGAFSQRYSWRWIFWINAPISAFAFLFVFLFLQVRAPAGDIMSKLALVDWIGNALIIAGTILGNVALTMAGVRYAWTDFRVIVPLVLSLVLMVAFVVYDKYVPRVPTMHWDVVSNRVALASLVATCFNGITSISIVYFLPLFFQAVFLASPLQSAVYAIPSALLISPFSFMNGLAVLKLQRYMPSNYVGWVVMIVGFGLVSILGAESNLAIRVVSQVIVAAGTGIVISSLTFPLMAPIPVERVGSALAFQSFLQTLSQTWGISISASILQNIVKRQFPARFIKQLPTGSQFAFAAVSRIAALPEPMQHEVRVAFAHGISAIYRVMIGFAGLGFLCVFFMREVQMRGNVDPTFALKDGREEPDVEKAEEMANGERSEGERATVQEDEKQDELPAQKV